MLDKVKEAGKDVVEVCCPLPWLLVQMLVAHQQPALPGDLAGDLASCQADASCTRSNSKQFDPCWQHSKHSDAAEIRYLLLQGIKETVGGKKDE